MALFKKRGKHVKGTGDPVVEEAAEAAEIDSETMGEPAQDGAGEPAAAQTPDEAGQEPDSAGEADGDDVGDAADAADADVQGKHAAVPADASAGGSDDAGDADESLLAGLDVDAQGYPLGGEMADPNAFVAAGFEVPSKKRRRALKVFGITMGVLLGIVLVVYIAGAIVFMGRFLPNTVVGSHDVSMKSDQEVVEILDEAVAGYQLDVVSGSFTYRTTAAQMNMSIDAPAVVATMHQDLNAWMWPVLIFESSHDESERLVVNYDRPSLAADFTEKTKAFNENATPPENATISYDEATKSFQVKPEVQGTQINADAAIAAIDKTLPLLQPKLELGVEQLVQPTVFADDEKLVESAKVATGMVSANVKLNMGGKQVGEINGESLARFVAIDEKLEVKLDEEALNAWIEELANGFNTKGSERHYVRADGKEISVGDGEYGWEIDNDAFRDALLEAIKTGANTTIDIPCWSEAEVYNGPGERDWGNRYIDIDLSEQYVRFYGDDGSIIWESACISGAPDGEHNTGLGVWYINNKESPSKLIGYEHGKKIYETTVTYWMAFEYSGIGLHDATWQPSFGGNMYANGYGSHGCVNLPYSAAQSLYDICVVGDVVVVHW